MHTKIILSALQSNSDWAKTTPCVCVQIKQSDRKTTQTSLFYPLICQRCVILYPYARSSIQLSLQMKTNIWSDGVSAMAGDGDSGCCAKISWFSAAVVWELHDQFYYVTVGRTLPFTTWQTGLLKEPTPSTTITCVLYSGVRENVKIIHLNKNVNKIWFEYFSNCDASFVFSAPRFWLKKYTTRTAWIKVHYESPWHHRETLEKELHSHCNQSPATRKLQHRAERGIDPIIRSSYAIIWDYQDLI